ncbi:unnamed protein product [Gordionus sp. m RMFG-2023]
MANLKDVKTFENDIKVYNRDEFEAPVALPTFNGAFEGGLAAGMELALADEDKLAVVHIEEAVAESDVKIYHPFRRFESMVNMQCMI